MRDSVERAIQTSAKPEALLAAKRFMADEDVSTAFTYAGFCQAALPHNRLPDDAPWQIRSENVTLLVEPGFRPGDDRNGPMRVGVPYGSRARLILFYLQTEAAKTRSRDVELGTSLTEWARRMGVMKGGKSHALIRDQAERISRCRLTFNIRRGQSVGLVNRQIIDQALLVPDDSQGDLFTSRARLSEDFYNELCRHSVPLQDSAIRHISNNSLAMDLYAWLAYRLHVLERPLRLSWPALHGQFGLHIAQIKHFRQSFKTNIDLALAVYPEASVTVQPDYVTLHPSTPPVSRTVPSLAAQKVLPIPTATTRQPRASTRPIAAKQSDIPLLSDSTGA